MAERLLEIRGLKTHFKTDDGMVHAVDGVGFVLAPGETLGLVGESGSGKSTTVLGILRMIKPPGRVFGGSVMLDDVDLLSLDADEMRQMRDQARDLVGRFDVRPANPEAPVGSLSGGNKQKVIIARAKFSIQTMKFILSAKDL